MAKALIDTDVIIDLVRGNDAVNGQVNSLLQECSLYISTISVMEILIGARNKNEVRYWSSIIDMCTPLELNETIGVVALDLIKNYHHSHGLGIPDALIAATALTEEIVLYTKNVKHFQMIPELKLY